jgi:hypothetical protein
VDAWSYEIYLLRPLVWYWAWTLEDKFHISVFPRIIFYFLVIREYNSFSTIIKILFTFLYRCIIFIWTEHHHGGLESSSQLHTTSIFLYRFSVNIKTVLLCKNIIFGLKTKPVYYMNIKIPAWECILALILWMTYKSCSASHQYKDLLIKLLTLPNHPLFSLSFPPILEIACNDEM